MKFYFGSLRDKSNLQDLDLRLDGKTIKGSHPLLAKRVAHIALNVTLYG
jgi:hypothetical protein